MEALTVTLFEFFRDLPRAAPEEGGLGYFPDIALIGNIVLGFFLFEFLHGPLEVIDNLITVIMVCVIVLALLLGMYAPLDLRRAVLIGVGFANMMLIVTHRGNDPS